jgi:hypothetical protein
MNTGGVSLKGDLPPETEVVPAQEKGNSALAKTRFAAWALAMAAAMALLGLGWLLAVVSQTFEATSLQKLRAMMTVIAIPVLLLWSHNRRRLLGRLRMLWIAVVAFIGAFGLGILVILFRNLQHPPMWDYLCFWLDGQVASRGLNFYEPINYHAVPLPFPPGPTFTAEILDVGFKYPPASMMLFMPLGWFDFRSGMIVWYTIQCSALAICIVLLWKNNLGGSGLAGIIEATAFATILAGTLTTLEFAQTNFLALLMLILFWSDRERARSGVWLVVGGFIKPFLLVLALFPILRKRWKVLGTAVPALSALVILSIGVFGLDTFTSYFTDSPLGRAPAFMYTEITNQSLLATVLRLGAEGVAGRYPLGHPFFMGMAILMTGITCWLVFSLRRDAEEWGIALALMLALVIYPASQFFYSVLLIVPLMLIWGKRDVIPVGPWGAGVLITVVYVLTVFSGYVFVANLLIWVVIAGLPTWALHMRKSASREKLQGYERGLLHQGSGNRA